MNAPARLDELLERRQALGSPASQPADFIASLDALRSWQAARLARTYRDFQDDPRYAPALEFFLSDLYGPQEFIARNRDLRRAWTYLRRALPAALLKVLRQAIELDVLTLELDHAMARALAAGAVTETAYAQAYRRVGDAASRGRQIELIIGIGTDLTRVVRRSWTVRCCARRTCRRTPPASACCRISSSAGTRRFAGCRTPAGCCRL